VRARPSRVLPLLARHRPAAPRPACGPAPRALALPRAPMLGGWGGASVRRGSPLVNCLGSGAVRRGRPDATGPRLRASMLRQGFVPLEELRNRKTASLTIHRRAEERSRSRLVGPILLRRAARLPTSLCSDSIGPQHAHLWKGARSATNSRRWHEKTRRGNPAGQGTLSDEKQSVWHYGS